MKRISGTLAILGLFLALPLMGTPIDIGYLSFDDGDPVSGQAAVGLANFTGATYGCYSPGFAVCDDLSFTNVVVSVDYTDVSGAPHTFSETLPGPFGPGVYDPLDATNLVFDDGDTFLSVSVALSFSPTTFSVVDSGGNQSEYQATGSTATATLLAPDPTTDPTALLTIDANPVLVSVPEPASFTLICAGFLLMLFSAVQRIRKHQ